MWIIYLISTLIIIYVLNRYFSGTQYVGHRPDLNGKTAIITGGNSGIGKETALALVAQGCEVIIGARDTQRSKAAVEQIKAKTKKDHITQIRLDLSDWESIKSFVSEIPWEKVDFLVNNAGIMALPRKKNTKQGHEIQWGVNHLGHFYLTYLLWEKLKKTEFFRIVNVSSLAHRKMSGFLKSPSLNFDDMNYEKEKYDSSEAYSRSKLYNVLFTHALAEKIDKSRGLVLSLHPGVVRTQITKYLLDGVVDYLLFVIKPIYAIFTKSSKEGAQTTLHTLFAQPQKLHNGSYYADCAIAKENPLVKKENWQKLWEISENQCKVKFDLQ